MDDSTQLENAFAAFNSIPEIDVFHQDSLMAFFQKLENILFARDEALRTELVQYAASLEATVSPTCAHIFENGDLIYHCS